jgi:hypothetical protein
LLRLSAAASAERLAAREAALAKAELAAGQKAASEAKTAVGRFNKLELPYDASRMARRRKLTSEEIENIAKQAAKDHEDRQKLRNELSKLKLENNPANEARIDQIEKEIKVLDEEIEKAQQLIGGPRNWPEWYKHPRE